MRPILSGDLLIAARALLCVPAPKRAGRMRQWLDESHWADGYRKRLGRAHPRWGNGSLMSRAMAEPLAPTGWMQGGEIEALGVVIAAVIQWRGRIGALQRRGLPLCESNPM